MNCHPDPEAQSAYALEDLEAECGVCVACFAPLPTTQPDDAVLCLQCALDEAEEN